MCFSALTSCCGSELQFTDCKASITVTETGDVAPSLQGFRFKYLPVLFSCMVPEVEMYAVVKRTLQKSWRKLDIITN